VNELGCPPGIRREMRRQVLRDGGLLRRRAGEVDHCADQLFPAIARVARAGRNQAGLMARDAQALDQLLARARGQSGRLALSLGSEWDEREDRGSRDGCS
jgi:hypothetical protein